MARRSMASGGRVCRAARPPPRSRPHRRRLPLHRRRRPLCPAPRGEPALGGDPLPVEAARPRPTRRPLAGDPLTISHVKGRRLLGVGWVTTCSSKPRRTSGRAPTTRSCSRAPNAPTPNGGRRSSTRSLDTASPPTATPASASGSRWPRRSNRAAAARAGLGRQPGERYRFPTAPGIRITTTDLEPSEAGELAAALQTIVHSTTDTYPG